jgi:hypothetical protein
MNEKQLAQVEEWLKGDHRYKLLDCTRTGILKLKGTLLQVWLACYMCENDNQQSWLSIPKLMELTGLSEHTVIDARRYLISIGAIRDTGHTANIMYENPRQGAYTCKVLTVDDPAKVAPPAKLAAPRNKRAAKSAPAKVAVPPVKVAGKGSVSGSGCGSLSDSKESNSTSDSLSEDSESTLSDASTIGKEQVASLLTPSGGGRKPKRKNKTKDPCVCSPVVSKI